MNCAEQEQSSHPNYLVFFRHYHSMEVFATFDVMDSKGVKVAEGHKASFCLEDNQCMPGVKPFYACANFGDQGISVNCSDIYRHNIDCQWVDISELNPGMYTFKVSYLSEDSSKKKLLSFLRSLFLPFSFDIMPSQQLIQYRLSSAILFGLVNILI
jgi:hypothetical protein